MTNRAEFWLSSGYHLLHRTADGKLRVTDDFLRAYFSRPEMRPVEESCAAERELHAALLARPRTAVPDARLDRLADGDVRENYRHVLAFRDRLVAHPTIEDCYLALFTDGGVAVPPLFIDQMIHVILRNILTDCGDPVRLRAAEIFFRSQKVSLRDSAILLADEEIVEMHAATGGMGSLGQLLIDNQTPTRQVELDVIDDANGATYWQRSDRFNTVVDLSAGRPALDAFCRVLEGWVAHLLDIAVSVRPLDSVHDERWVWHVGLDAESSAILDDLYQGHEIDDERRARLISLFRLQFRDTSVMLPALAGRPVYLALAMGDGKTVKMKPQNLLFNLPLAAAA